SIDAGGVAARPGEAGDETKLDWVFANDEYDRDGRCCSFGRERMNCAAGRDDHRHLSADEIGDHCLQAIGLALCPMGLDRHVLAFEVAGFVKAFAEGGHKMRDDIGRPDVDEPDHWLPSARRLWPRHRRAAEQRDELATFHSITSSARASSVDGTSRPSALAV